MRLNASLREVERWDEDAIVQRSEMLAQKAFDVWQHHGVHLENNQVKKSSWTLADHPFLVNDKLELFEQLRSQILRLDTSIRERINKRVVTYSMNTIFVDIVPQAKRLLLSLNLPYATINDPEGLCKDVTTLGRWGVGDVEVGVSSVTELEYIMPLIRQAYERQVAVET